MIYAVALGLALALGALISHVLKRAFASAKSAGEPTAETVKIETKTATTVSEIAARGEQQQAEVSNASPDDLLAKLRDSLRRE